MAGDIENPRIWALADVYVAPPGTTAPTNVVDAWPAGWAALGLIGTDGIELGRSQDTKKQYAYGIGLYRTVRSKHERSIKVVCLEDTPAVFDLTDPGSTASTTDGVTTRQHYRPAPNTKAFGVELTDGDIVKRLVFPLGEVSDVETIKATEEDPEMKTLTVDIYANDSGLFFVSITNDPQAAVS